jgi:NitT/TauT family transport system ATP-binding protein
MLKLEDVSFEFGDKEVLKKVSFHVEPGSIVSLIGVSGSGKTTLFRLITDALKPSSGAIYLSSPKDPLNRISPQDAQNLITYMRQEDLLLKWRNVLENLLLFTEFGPHRDKYSPKKACLLLEMVGLKGCETLYPHELSGGMRQRVSLARALLQDRPLLLLDEPFGSLDVIIREELYQLLTSINKEQKKTILLVTHDFRDALTLSDRIIVLHQGKIEREFEVDENLRKDPKRVEYLNSQIRETLVPRSTL